MLHPHNSISHHIQIVKRSKVNSDKKGINTTKYTHASQVQHEIKIAVSIDQKKIVSLHIIN